MKAIFVPLATVPFRRFECGEKFVEIRQADSPVARQVLKAPEDSDFVPVVLSRGYSTTERLHGTLGEVWVAPRLNQLEEHVLDLACIKPGEARAYFDPKKPVVAFAVNEPQGEQSWGWQATRRKANQHMVQAEACATCGDEPCGDEKRCQRSAWMEAYGP